MKRTALHYDSKMRVNAREEKHVSALYLKFIKLHCMGRKEFKEVRCMGVGSILVRETFRGRPRVGRSGGPAPGDEKFSKIFKKLLRKLLKCIIEAHFKEILTNHALIFPAFGQKTHCWEVLRKS